LPLWCQDEAGPYQAVPHPGPSWQPEGKAACQPHEYLRGVTAKLLTLFRPATGEVRALAVEHATNEVLHPWLKQELEAILGALGPADPAGAGEALGRSWSEWEMSEERVAHWVDPPPPIRMVLVWDNLRGHQTSALVRWCIRRGILLLYTPVGGSWLNMAESLQRIVVRRALSGQHPQSAEEVREWLTAAVKGWNAAPTPFEWGGKRAERRRRARERRHALGGSGAFTRRPIPRPRRSAPSVPHSNG
jgi:hypothetical protein